MKGSRDSALHSVKTVRSALSLSAGHARNAGGRLAAAGHVAQAPKTIDKAITTSLRDDESWWIAELLRSKAELIWRVEGAHASPSLRV